MDNRSKYIKTKAGKSDRHPDEITASRIGVERRQLSKEAQREGHVNDVLFREKIDKQAQKKKAGALADALSSRKWGK